MVINYRFTSGTQADTGIRNRCTTGKKENGLSAARGGLGLSMKIHAMN